MYNRYMQHVQDVNDFVELGGRDGDPRGAPGAEAFDRPPQMPPFFAQHDHRPPEPHFPEPGHMRHGARPPSVPGRPGTEGSIFARLLGGLKVPKLEFDDLLLLLIVFLILREEGDDDLILIAAALFLAGM